MVFLTDFWIYVFVNNHTIDRKGTAFVHCEDSIYQNQIILKINLWTLFGPFGPNIDTVFTW